MLQELLGLEDGLCEGHGGHMHLLSAEHLAATSGIVGASLPTAAGFALAAKRLRPRCVGVAFTGDGAMNQGMALETLNLAVAWTLPLLVVCVDNGWAIRAGNEETDYWEMTKALFAWWNSPAMVKARAEVRGVGTVYELDEALELDAPQHLGLVQQLAGRAQSDETSWLWRVGWVAKGSS